MKVAPASFHNSGDIAVVNLEDDDITTYNTSNEQKHIVYNNEASAKRWTAHITIRKRWVAGKKFGTIVWNAKIIQIRLLFADTNHHRF